MGHKRQKGYSKMVVDSCVLCKKEWARRAQQVMADLPPERTQPATPFQFTTVDLFGPYLVKNDVKRRVTLKTWVLWFPAWLVEQSI